MKICLKCSAIVQRDDWKCLSCGWNPEIRSDFPILAPTLETGSSDYPLNSHDQLVQVEENNFWFVNRNLLLSYFLEKYFSKTRNFLEIGCGTGFVLSGLAELHPTMNFYGAEGYISGLIHAKKRLPTATFIQLDACNMPFIEEFDVIGAFDLIEHIPDDEIALHHMYKALKKNGGLLLTVPQHPFLWSKTDEKAGHKRRYKKKELVQKVNSAGFNIQLITSFVTLLLPLMTASRLLNASKNKPQVGLRLHSRINSTFLQICRLERSIIRNGFYLPFGGSLVCIAIKS